MNTFTGSQARLVSDTLALLDNFRPERDGMRVTVFLMDDVMGPVGTFIEEDGVWIFETVGE